MFEDETLSHGATTCWAGGCISNPKSRFQRLHVYAGRQPSPKRSVGRQDQRHAQLCQNTPRSRCPALLPPCPPRFILLALVLPLAKGDTLKSGSFIYRASRRNPRNNAKDSSDVRLHRCRHRKVLGNCHLFQLDSCNLCSGFSSFVTLACVAVPVFQSGRSPASAVLPSLFQAGCPWGHKGSASYAKSRMVASAPAEKSQGWVGWKRTSRTPRSWAGAWPLSTFNGTRSGF